MVRLRPPNEDEGVTLKPVPDAEVQLRREAQNMGKIGVWFGSRENAALYLCAFMALIAMLGLVVLAFRSGTAETKLLETFFAVVMAALGFIGGLLSAKNL